MPRRVVKVSMPEGGIATGAPIPSAMVISDGGELKLNGRDFVGFEIEIAAHLSHDLTPAIVAGGVEAVRAIIDYFTISVEVIGSRIDDRTKAGDFGPLADLGITGGYILGSARVEKEPSVDGLPVVLTVDGRITQMEVSRHPFGDAITPMIAFAQQADDHFGGVQNGLFVTTGSLSPLLIAPRNANISIQLGDFPPVSFSVRS